MVSNSRARVRCAIYTRKSSEEGLEQSFNSLDAQREACEAFIASQRHEGWQPVSTRYDDGGYSGGTMNRPGLKHLLLDIDGKKVDVVVVYKVDRLTRALSDFAKIIEIFDAHQVSFVSVTQQFNTTSSMGRLTLNVLLSFAQFEREVTGERIRDKIAASKKRGLWMGGMVPAGYVVKERKLIVEPEAAERIREIYRQYLKLGCVSKLKRYLDKLGPLAKKRVNASGQEIRAASYAPGGLYHTLKNRIYIGEIPYKGTNYPGEHEPIVPRDLWEQVQNRLQENCQSHRNASYAQEPSLLAGLVYHQNGRRFRPAHTLKNKKRYRYYVLKPPLGDSDDRVHNMRLPASTLETAVLCGLRSFFRSTKRVTDALKLRRIDLQVSQQVAEQLASISQRMTSFSAVQTRSFLRSLLNRVIVQSGMLEIQIRKQELRSLLGLKPLQNREASSIDLLTLKVDVQFIPTGGQRRLIMAPEDSGLLPDHPERALIKAVARARDWVDRMVKGEITNQRSIAKQTGLDERYVSRILECAWLEPEIVEAILNGRQPSGMTLESLVSDLPSEWSAQCRRLGFPSSRQRQ